MKNFGERLKNILETKNISQKKLAEKTGLTEAAITNYIKNERIPRIDIILSISKALEVTVFDLIYQEDEFYNFFNTKTLLNRSKSRLTQEEKQELLRILINE